MEDKILVEVVRIFGYIGLKIIYYESKLSSKPIRKGHFQL